MSVLERLHGTPAIPTLYGLDKLDAMLAVEPGIALLANIPLVMLGPTIERLRDSKVFTILNLDSIPGLSSTPDGLEYCNHLGVQGILSTQAAAVTRAPSFGMLSVQKGFVTDRNYAQRLRQSIKQNRPHMVQLMPAPVIPMLEHSFFDSLPPFMTSGFVRTEQQIEEALELGAVAVSTTAENLWTFRKQ